MMKIWNTKYCLTTGITTHDAKECGDGMVSFKYDGNSMATYLHGEGVQWHKTEDQAAIRAEAVKVNKTSSLHKQLERLSKLTFT